LEFGEAVDPVLLALAVFGDDFGGGVLDEVALPSLQATFLISHLTMVISPSRHFFRGGIDDAL